MALNILLADDNEAFALAIRQFLRMIPGAQVVGQAYSGLEALALAQELRPDLVVLDIALPDMSGLEVARQMQSWPSAPRIVFLSMHDGAAYRATARELGAIAYVGKTDFVADLLPMLENLIAQPEFRGMDHGVA
jgi:DNA-binding NarL/FixJ family response regulator